MSGTERNVDHLEAAIPYEPQKVDTIIGKPEFSFLARYYNLLYQSFIPNCSLTIATLRHHCPIPDNVENYILNGSNRRKHCQRLLDYLLVQLDGHRDYMQFCYYLTIVSVVTNLPFRLVAEFRTNGSWGGNIPIHPKLIPPKLQSMESYTDYHNSTGASAECDCGHSDTCMSQNSAAQVEDDDDLAFTLNHQTVNCFDNGYYGYCDASGDKGCTVVCRPPEARQIKHVISHTGNQSNAVTLPSDVEVIVDSSNGLNEGSSAVNGNLENEDSLYTVGMELFKSRYSDILQSLSNDYEQTLDIIQDELTDDQICSVLSCSEPTTANKLILDSLIEKAKCRADLLQLCNQLQQIMPSSPGLGCLTNVVCEIQALLQSPLEDVVNPPSSPMSSTEIPTTTDAGATSELVASLPDILLQKKEFSQLKQHYHSILHLMPHNYEQTLGRLQNFINDDQMCAVLSCNSFSVANKLILDCLVERMKFEEDLFDFCDRLEMITGSQDLNIIISEIRSGVEQSIQIASGNIQSPFANMQKPFNFKMKSQSEMEHDIFEMIFSKTSLDPNSKVKALLKKHCSELCQCLPQDYMKTITKIREHVTLSEEQLQHISTYASTKIINMIIVGLLIEPLQADVEILEICKVLDGVVSSPTSKSFIQFLRHEFLKVLSSTIPTTAILSLSNAKEAITTEQSSSGTVTQSVSSTMSYNKPDGKAQPVPTTTKAAAGATAKPTGPLPSTKYQKRPQLQKDLQERMIYEQNRLQQGFKYQQPPTLPPNCVHRVHLLDKMATKLSRATIDPNSFGTSLTVTGAGGYGKTTLAKALCHHKDVQEQFTDGFVFIELGPQATDPGRILCQLYHLLTDKDLKQGDVNVVAKKVKQITKEFFCNLLVIIDDVWHVEDAEPLVTAFCNCKTVLTTRMNNITNYIPAKETIIAGPMECDEAVDLLTCGLVENKWTSSEISLLSKLAQDIYLWPLLLSLVRGQLSHNLKLHKLPKQEAIHNVSAKLQSKGLTAFDRNNLEKSNRNRKYAVKACIEVTLELLPKQSSDKIKTLIIFNGIGTSLPTPVLHNLWKVPDQDANDAVEMLWSYGLVTFTDVTIPPCNTIQTSVEVHAVISQYVIDNLESEQVVALSPFGQLGTFQAVNQGLLASFRKSYGLSNVTNVITYLKYTLSEIEHVKLPHCFKMINSNAIFDPHDVIILLKQIQEVVGIFPNVLSLFVEQFAAIKAECVEAIKKSHILTRVLNQKIQKCLFEKNFESLLLSLQEYHTSYPMWSIAVNSVELVKNIIPMCEGEVLLFVTEKCEMLQIKQSEYSAITLMEYPRIKVFIEQYNQAESALRTGSPSAELVYQNITSGKMFQPIYTKYFNKLKEVAPNFARRL